MVFYRACMLIVGIFYKRTGDMVIELFNLLSL